MRPWRSCRQPRFPYTSPRAESAISSPTGVTRLRRAIPGPAVLLRHAGAEEQASACALGRIGEAQAAVQPNRVVVVLVGVQLDAVTAAFAGAVERALHERPAEAGPAGLGLGPGSVAVSQLADAGGGRVVIFGREPELGVRALDQPLAGGQERVLRR